MGAGLDKNNTVIPSADVLGRTIFGYDPAAGAVKAVQVDGAGALVISGGPPPAATLGPTPADTPLLPLAVAVPLPIGPAGTTQQIVQNTGPAGAQIRVRELGGVAGAGIILPRFGIFVFDAGFALEVDEISGAVGAVMVTWES
jgi:hypothetical protein